MDIRNAPESALRFLRWHLGRFENPEGDRGASAGIVVDSIPKDDFPESALFQAANSPYGMSVGRFEGAAAIFFTCRGAADMILIPSDPIRICFVNSPRVFNRMYILLLFCLRMALTRKEALLLHAAAVVKGDECVMAFGLRHSKKTELMMHLLRDGWDYLADDKLILHKGKAHIFSSQINIRDHHLRDLPWLLDLPAFESRGRKQEFFRNLRGRLLDLAPKHLPTSLLRPIRNRLNALAQVEAEDLFPACRAVQSFQPTNWVLLSASEEKMSIEKVSMGDLAGAICAIQNVYFYEHGALQGLFEFCSEKSENSQFLEILRIEAAKQSGIRIFTPPDLPAKALYEEFCRGCASL